MNAKQIEKIQERLLTARRRVGKFCVRHPDLCGIRYKYSGVCIQCSADNRRRWAKAHPEQIRAINIRAVNKKKGISDDLAPETSVLES